MATGILHVSASFPRSGTDPVAPFLLDLVGVQRDAGWVPSVVAAHDAGLPSRHELAGVPVRRVRYGPDRWEVLVYRGGGHGGLRSPLHAALLPASRSRCGSPRAARCGAPIPMSSTVTGCSGWADRPALAPRRARQRVVITLHGTDVELAAAVSVLSCAASRDAPMHCSP